MAAPALLLDSRYSALPAQRSADPAPQDARPVEPRTSSKIAELLINDIHDAGAAKPEQRDAAIPSMETLPPMDAGEMSSEMSLREHLLAAQAGIQGSANPQGPPSHSNHAHHQSPPDSLRHAGSPPIHAIERGPPPPAGYDGHTIQPSTYDMSQVDTEMSNDPMDSSDAKRGGKRELSTSKRAAQNRAAQRAFRQRKEGYIKKLEEENRQMKIAIDESYSGLSNENYQLRDYCITLQNRLQEVQGSYPPPPPNVSLRDARTGEPSHTLGEPAAAMATSAVTQLQQAAAAPVPPGYESARQDASGYPVPNTDGAPDARPPEAHPSNSDAARDRRS